MMLEDCCTALLGSLRRGHLLLLLRASCRAVQLGLLHALFPESRLFGLCHNVAQEPPHALLHPKVSWLTSGGLPWQQQGSVTPALWARLQTECPDFAHDAKLDNQ